MRHNVTLLMAGQQPFQTRTMSSKLLNPFYLHKISVHFDELVSNKQKLPSRLLMT